MKPKCKSSRPRCEATIIRADSGGYAIALVGPPVARYAVALDHQREAVRWAEKMGWTPEPGPTKKENGKT